VSSLTTDKGIVHYEVYGRGRPVILLHGWLGSWGLWQETMSYLGSNYRTYALDFWGFGESGKKLSTYQISDFVGLVDQFMDELGITEAPVVGHSMGGTVSLSLALQYPNRVSSVTVIGSPIDGKSLAWTLKMAGYRPIAMLVHNLMWALKFGIKVSAPLITKDKRWYEMIEADLEKTTVESFLTSISSLHKTNISDTIQKIDVPIMGMYGNKDVIVNPNQWKPLKANGQNIRIERFTNAGHFLMLDEPKQFQQTLMDFLETNQNNAQNHSA
jgi:pimeloyl-ACP methyl ester carboxylesterase